MAIGRLSMKVGKAGKAGPHAAYIAREGQYANRLERGERLEATEADNMPAWAQSNPLAFWQAADAYERKNGTTYREMEIALPRELDAEQRAALCAEVVAEILEANKNTGVTVDAENNLLPDTITIDRANYIVISAALQTLANSAYQNFSGATGLTPSDTNAFGLQIDFFGQ